jgi:hypothetical protein
METIASTHQRFHYCSFYDLLHLNLNLLLTVPRGS